MQTIKIGKREFPLALTLDALGDINRMLDKNLSVDAIIELVRNPSTIGDVIYCLMKHGAIAEGETLDVDRAWVGSKIRPGRLNQIQMAVMAALEEGMAMESEEEEEDVEEDVVLSEIKKNEATD